MSVARSEASGTLGVPDPFDAVDLPDSPRFAVEGGVGVPRGAGSADSAALMVSATAIPGEMPGIPRMEGLGHDVVDIPDFSRRLRIAGSRMPLLFSARERRQCSLLARRHGDGEARHLAARWAGKESVVKAWCEAVEDPPYSPDDLPWEAIEILDDRRGVPRVLLRDDLCAALSEGVGVRVTRGRHPGGSQSEPSGDGTYLRWHVSLSHDGDVASAVVVLILEPMPTR